MDVLLEAPAIVGEIEAGQAAKARKHLAALIKSVNSSTFDIAEGLHEIKNSQFYAPKFNTFSEYAKTLDLKVSKAYYLVRIIESMLAAGLTRTEYEPLGIAKLRIISRLETTGDWVREGVPPVPMPTVIKDITLAAADKTAEQLKDEVNNVLGLNGDDAIVWMNIALKHSARELVRKALELAKKNIGSVGKDDEGISKDPSDGAALEVLAVDFLQDPNNFYDTDLLKEDTKQHEAN